MDGSLEPKQTPMDAGLGCKDGRQSVGVQVSQIETMKIKPYERWDASEHYGDGAVGYLDGDGYIHVTWPSGDTAVYDRRDGTSQLKYYYHPKLSWIVQIIGGEMPSMGGLDANERLRTELFAAVVELVNGAKQHEL